jgi:hypothetical protein
MRSRDSKGQALIEFILVIPLFLVVMLGVVQFSLLYFAYQMVHYASFAAARAAIVRPCAAIHPDDSGAANFTPAVFTAAVLATTVATPPQCMLRAPGGPGSGSNVCLQSDLDTAFPFLPALPPTPEVLGLDFDPENLAGQGEIALTKYINAAFLTSVQRVESPSLSSRPIVWDPNDAGPGPGIPCDDPGGQQQNVPPPGSDITLEVTLIYPLTVPLVNRVIYGVFVNFSSMARDRLGLDEISGSGPEAGPEDVMVTPTRILVPIERYSEFGQAMGKMYDEFGYPLASVAEVSTISNGLADRAWFPLPVRARCTLTVEGAVSPIGGPPGSRGW